MPLISNSGNKENEASVPETPAHLLKKQFNTYDIEPKQHQHSKLKINRLPLASKDNNRFTSHLLQSKNKLNFGKNSSVNFKKYGSILQQDNGNVQRVKSLVLKDIDNNADSESDSDEDNDLHSKLQNALSRRTEGTESKGLFGTTGLSNLIESQKEEIDREIEYVSMKQDELPYVPDGYSTLTNTDIEKLKDYHYKMGGYDDEDEGNNQIEMLALEDMDDTTDLEHSGIYHNHIVTDRKHLTQGIQASHIEIDSIYNGDGLDADDMLDLLN